VVIVGGVDSSGSYLSSVELLNLNAFKANNTGWVMGPSMPLTVFGSTMHAFQNGVILIGGTGQVDGTHLYQLSSPNGTWTAMKQTLKVGRNRHVSFLVPDAIVTCH
jgi:hypothetical protein